MYRITTLLLTILFTCTLITAQVTYRNNSSLLIDTIMKGQEFTGYSPERIQWSEDSKAVFFKWNPEMKFESSWYSTDLKGSAPVKISPETERDLSLAYRASWNKAHDQRVYVKNGSLVIENIKKNNIRYLLENFGNISDPAFSNDESEIFFTLEDNLFSCNLASGKTEKLSNIQKGDQKRMPSGSSDEQQEWLKKDQMELFSVLRSRADAKQGEMLHMKELKAEPALKPVNIGNGNLAGISISPDKNFLFLLLFDRAEGKNTEIPVFVTESGFTETEQSRNKVGVSYGKISLKIYDRRKDSLYTFIATDIPGIYDVPEYRRKDNEPAENMRSFNSSLPVWSDDGSRCFIQVFAEDHKDRWILLLNPADGTVNLVDRQHDPAWIGGPGIGGFREGASGWLPGSLKLWFMSEETGFSHIYTFNILTGEKKALTSGTYEVYDPELSREGKYWYFTSNEKDPGIHHFYRMNLDGTGKIQLTTKDGGNEAVLSPDEKWIAFTYSYANLPPELYIQKNAAGQQAVKVTHSTTAAFEAYNWRIPGFIQFKAGDGASVPARLYKPDEAVKNGAAVIFVHGAGYLQNAHQWWSDYYHEYMFHNFLADNGYTVLDIDYRGSAGYGRDWRTAIYRHMGGKDLSDQVDGAKYLIEQAGIDPEKIGIYGGSYGGFITLMALFTTSDVFRCGAALRSVTDWAHYNHGYTSNILNTPVEDSLAYRQSSPIYFADGLQGKLLMCHGMMDDNVHFQDIVRLSQRLIELRKENWELAVYPMERHSFVEPTSWSDEYRRIYRLFEETIGGN